MTSLDALVRPEYPRTSRYDPQWTVDQCMGPNPLWLLEDLLRDGEPAPGSRVLDLGCGTGLTSIFLARECGAEVRAADWWVPAEDNAARFREAGVDDRVRAVSAEAHALPFENGQFEDEQPEDEQFDAIVSVDAYHYFGTDDLYIGYLSRFLRPGGRLSIAVPSVRRELRELGGIPEHLRESVGWEVLSFHTPEWWRFHWEQTGLVRVVESRAQPRGCEDWKLWAEVCAEHSPHEVVRRASRDEVDLLESDRGEHLTFALVTAVKPEE